MFTPLDLESVLSMFENQAYNAHYDLDYSDPSRIVLTPKENEAFMPVIVGDLKTNGDETSFWYSPTMNFPTPISEEMTDGAHFSYYMEGWVKAAKLADYLLDNSWPTDREYGE